MMNVDPRNDSNDQYSSNSRPRSSTTEREIVELEKNIGSGKHWNYKNTGIGKNTGITDKNGHKQIKPYHRNHTIVISESV